MSLHVLSHRPFLRISHQCNGDDDDGGDGGGDDGDGDGDNDGYGGGGGGGGGDNVPHCFFLSILHHTDIPLMSSSYTSYSSSPI